MNEAFGENYLEKLRSRVATPERKPPTAAHALADEIINYFRDPTINFKSIFFGVIRNGIGYQGAYAAFNQMRKDGNRNVKYFWGIVRKDKKAIVLLDRRPASALEREHQGRDDVHRRRKGRKDYQAT